MNRFAPAFALLLLLLLIHLPALVTPQTRERTVGPTVSYEEVMAKYKR